MNKNYDHSKFKEAWFSSDLGYLEIIDRSNGRQTTFELIKKYTEPRYKYSCKEDDCPLDTNVSFGCNGFKRMRSLENISCELWQTEQMDTIQNSIYDMSEEELKNVEEVIAHQRKILESEK